jgi:hypothetical protein
VVFAPKALARTTSRSPRFRRGVLRVDAAAASRPPLGGEACRMLRWFDRTPLAAPWTFEGLKTAGLEIAEQLCEAMPDWIAVADPEAEGEGELVAAVAAGLEGMRRAGLVQAVPRILAVEAADRVRLGSALKGREAEAGWARAAKAVRQRRRRGGGGGAAGGRRGRPRGRPARRARRGPRGRSCWLACGRRRARGVLEKGRRVLALVGGRRRGGAPAAQGFAVGGSRPRSRRRRSAPACRVVGHLARREDGTSWASSSRAAG